MYICLINLYIDYCYTLVPISFFCRLALNTNVFKNRNVLEIGAGNALCGMTVGPFASHVTISDFNEVVLRNIENTIALNSGEYKMTYLNEYAHQHTCLGAYPTEIEVWL